MEDAFALLLKKPGLGIVVSDGIKNRYLFAPGSREHGSVDGKIMTD